MVSGTEASQRGARVHELLFWIQQGAPSDSTSSSDGANNSDVLIAIVGSVGSLLAIGMTALLASFRRPKTPDSTVDSIENQSNIRHEAAIAAQMQSMREDLDEANYAKDNAVRMYQQLREAVWRKGLNPDHLMEEAV